MKNKEVSDVKNEVEVRKFFYNEELYEDIKSDENLVICASLGGGKSESVKKHLSETNSDKILLVVNDGHTQESYFNDLPHKIVVHNKLKTDYWDEFATQDYEEAYNSLTEEKNVLCVTKSKFNKLLIIRPASLMTFTKVIIDESNGLNPIMVTDLTTDIEKIINSLSSFMKIKANFYFNGILDMITYLKNVRNKFIDEEIALFYQEEIQPELQQTALNLIKNIRRLYNEKKMFGLNDVDLLFGVLNSIANNSFYLGDIVIKGRKQIHMLFANTFLHDYIKSTNSTIKILDGTADNIKPLYDWLKIKVRKDYKCNDKEYPNLKIHIHRYKNLTPAKGRKSLEHTTRIVNEILNEKRNNELTFTINSLAKEKIFQDNFNLLEWAFNGKDVGSNEFRNMTEMNIIYYQTLPRTYRMVYNKLFKDTSFQESCSHYYMEKAESELIGAMLCQLIGRLKIRQDNNAIVNVHCYCISRESLIGVIKHYKLKEENIVLYDEVDIGVDLHNVKEGTIIETLENYLKNDKPEKVILVDWIRENFYDKHTTQETIKSAYKSIRNKINIDGYKLIVLKGRGQKAYLERIKN